jgi:transposase
MSLQPQAVYIVPAETDRVAHAIFPTPNIVMRMYDEFGVIFNDADFADLFPNQGQPAEAPVRLALATILQFMEGLTDRQAADAVRTRIDWKYLLCLEMTDPGFDHTVLSEFRTRLLEHGAEQRLFNTLIELARDRGLLKAGGRQRTDSTHVLSAARTLNRLECVTETLRHALNGLANVAPTWLLKQTKRDWGERYSLRASDFRLPKSASGRLAWAKQVGADGMSLLDAIYKAGAPRELRELEAVQILRQVWVQNFWVQDAELQWRENDNTPPSGRYIGSPYDTDVRFAYKGTTVWTGYKVHLTETCDDEGPNLITNVATTSAAVADDAVTGAIHAALSERKLLPDKHIADTGFVNSLRLVESEQQYQIELIGPTRADNHWQAKAGTGFAAQNFVVDWEQQRATCPEGQVSSSWTPAVDRFKNKVIKIKFGQAECGICPSVSKCTRSKRPRRTITIRPQAQHEALLAGRQREQSREYKQEYRRRAGVEGTIAQGVRSTGVRQARYFGQAKTHLQHLMSATAMNLIRMVRWLMGEKKATTPVSPFARLYQRAA